MNRIQVTLEEPKSSTPKKSSSTENHNEAAVPSTTRSRFAPPLQDLNKTIDTSLTNLSGLPSLKPVASSSSGKISGSTLSFDIDEILKQSDAGLLDDEDLQIADDLKLDTANPNLKDDKLKQDDFLSLLLSTPTLPTSSVATTGGTTEPPKAANALTLNKTSSSLPSLPLSKSSNNSAPPTDDVKDDEDLYEDDFEPDVPKHNEDEYSLSKENLSEMSEEIESDSSDDDFNIGNQKLILQTSDLLSNKDFKVVTPDSSDLSQEEDYNKLSETDYNRRKAAMEMDFKKKQIKPDHPGFVYDKEVKFDAPKIESEWDNMSTDSEF